MSAGLTMTIYDEKPTHNPLLGNEVGVEFHVDGKELDALLNICKKNGKFVEVEFKDQMCKDYTEGSKE